MSEEKKNPAVWSFSSQEPDRAEVLKDALRTVHDPEMGYSVIDLGLIRNVELKDGRIIVTMILTSPFCPYGPQMVDEIRTAAQTAVKEEVVIDLRMDMWDPSMIEDGFDLDWGLF